MSECYFACTFLAVGKGCYLYGNAAIWFADAHALKIVVDRLSGSWQAFEFGDYGRVLLLAVQGDNEYRLLSLRRERNFVGDVGQLDAVCYRCLRLGEHILRRTEEHFLQLLRKSV